MKSPNKLISSLLAGIATMSIAQAQQYSSNPVYSAPTIAADGQSATVLGTWSPAGIDPVNFQAIISLAYSSSSVYRLGATQITGTGTGVGITDSYSYRLTTEAPTTGDVVTMNVNYTGLDQAGPAAGIVWDNAPGFHVNKGFNGDDTIVEANIDTVDESALKSVFNPFSTTFTMNETGIEDPGDGSVTKFESDTLIFTSAKQGPVTWEATAVPEPSSAILLTLGAGFMLRRKR